MAAALAQHAAPPPSMAPTRATDQSRPGFTQPGPQQTRTGVLIPHTTLVRAGAAVVAIGVLVGLGVVFLHGSTATGPTAPLHSSTAAAAAASRSQPLTASASTSASPSLLPGLDPCVVGTWRTVTETVTNTINGEPTKFTGPGPTVTYRPDGTGFTDFGSGITLSADVDGASWTEVLIGIDTYDYQTSSGLLLFSNIQASGTETIYQDGVENSSIALGHKSTLAYICSGDTLTYGTGASGGTVLTRSG